MLSDELKEILDILPVSVLRDLARENSLPVSGNRTDITNRLKESINEEDVLEKWVAFEEAGLNNDTFGDYGKSII